MEDKKPINPSTDNGHYLIQIISNDGKVVKEVLALNSTIKIVGIGEQSLAAILK